MPSGRCFTFTTVIPNTAAIFAALATTALCSAAEVTILSHPKSVTADLSARLSASVPPEVKMIDLGSQCNLAAISLLLISINALAFLPTA